MTATTVAGAPPRSTHHATPVEPGPSPARRVAQVRTLAVSVGLFVLAFVQAPGLVVPDTKLDLSVDPVGFLVRTLHLWEPQGASGELQNQAYGYLFPMGPFFALGHALHIPPWVVQRLWWALLLLVAFHGMRRLLAALGVQDPTSRLVAAVAYALSARVVTGIGGVSVEIWPLALAPWVLRPLVVGSREGSERRAAARSALAVLCVGGVNAVATGAVLVLPAWWLLTRANGPRRRRLAGWWVLCTGLATAWWVLPLLLLGRYSPPFLDWIESATVTTAPNSAMGVLRGTTHWVAYIGGSAGATWPAGMALVTDTTVILNSVALLVLGVAGLARRDLRDRAFVVGGLLVGVLILTFGHSGPLAPPWDAIARDLLDGSLAPLRNLHKFQLLVTIPLTIGLAHLLSSVRMRPVRGVPGSARTLKLVAALAVVGAATPALAGQLPARGSFQDLPDYWRQAAAWLSSRAGDGRALLVPAASSAAYYWGNPRDEPLQPLAGSPWAVRDGVPLSSAGNIRFLDTVERALQGRGDPGLAAYLAGGGVEYVVVRNDLDWAASGAPRPLAVDASLQRSGGFTRVASFGPTLDLPGPDPTSVVDSGLSEPVPAIEVYRVGPYAGPVAGVPASAAVAVVGGPESVLQLTDAGLMDGRPAILDGDVDPAAPPATTYVTDGLRRVEVSFGSVRDNTSQTLTSNQPFRAPRRVHDYLAPGQDARLTVAAFDPPVTASASSSGSDATALVNRNPAYSPAAAFDGDATTSWRSASLSGAVGQWLQLRIPKARSVAPLTVVLDQDPSLAEVTRLRVSTDAGTRDTDVFAAGGAQTLDVPPGATATLRLTVVGVRGGDESRTVGIADVALPGLVVTRTLVVPGPGVAAPASAYSFRTVRGARDGCLFSGDVARCAAGLDQPGEEDSALDRTFSVARESLFGVSGTVLPRGGPYVDRLLVPLGPAIVATATSSLVDDPAVRPQAAVDASMATGWVAGPTEPAPTLTLTWPGARTIGALRLVVDPTLAASRPAEVYLRFGPADPVGAAYDVGADGSLSFPAVRTDRVSITFLSSRHVTSTDPRTGRISVLPVGVSEVQVPGVDELRRGIDPRASTELPCGFGPPLSIDGRTYPTRATGTIRDLLELAPLSLHLCGDDLVRLSAGEHRARVEATAQALPDSLSLVAPTFVTGVVPGAVSASALAWGPENRAVAVGSRSEPAYLVVHENANAGWRATLGGRTLTAVQVEGWQQGWLLPAGPAGTVTLVYVPGRSYRIALLVGLLLALTLVPLAVVRRRRRASRRAPVGERPLQVAQLVFGCAVLLLVAGPAGALVLVAAALLLTFLPAGASVFLAPGLVAAGGALVVLRPAAQTSSDALGWVVQALTLLGLSVLVLVPWQRWLRAARAPASAPAGAAAPEPDARAGAS